MKILLSCICFCLLSLAGTARANDIWIAYDARAFAIKKASVNIADNMTFLANIRKEMGESSMLSWATPVADKIPSQPVAVIQLMALMDTPIDDMCPRFFHEDERSLKDTVYWMEQAIKALSVFTLNNSKEEKIRQECVQAIQKTLDNRDNWRVNGELF